MAKSKLDYYEQQIHDLKVGALIYAAMNGDWKIVTDIIKDDVTSSKDVIIMYNFMFNDYTSWPRYVYIDMIHRHSYEVYFPEKKKK